MSRGNLSFLIFKYEKAVEVYSAAFFNCINVMIIFSPFTLSSVKNNVDFIKFADDSVIVARLLQRKNVASIEISNQG